MAIVDRVAVAVGTIKTWRADVVISYRVGVTGAERSWREDDATHGIGCSKDRRVRRDQDCYIPNGVTLTKEKGQKA